jgi:hypothetical protein
MVESQRTRLALSEELVCIPGDDTAGQSAPAPFHDTAKGLCMLAVRVQTWGVILPMALSSAAPAQGLHR